MEMKDPGPAASGPARPEFMNGDTYRDKYGGTVTIKGVAERCITYRREGYNYDCMMPVYRFQRDFSLVYAAPRSRPISRGETWGNIQKMEITVNGPRGKK